MSRKLITSFDATVPPTIFRIEADLVGFWGVYACKADLVRTDNKRVAVNDFGNARNISDSLCGYTSQHQCRECYDKEFHSAVSLRPRPDNGPARQQTRLCHSLPPYW